MSAFRGAVGRAIARASARAFFVAAIATAPGAPVLGCLVTSDPDFRGQEDCVPYFVVRDADPEITSTLKLRDGALPELRVPLRSCALVKRYFVRIFVDGLLFATAQIEPSGQEIRTLRIGDLPVGLLQPGCHQLEVYASGAFATERGRDPVRDDDLAYIAWWFTTVDGATFESCRDRRST